MFDPNTVPDDYSIFEGYEYEPPLVLAGFVPPQFGLNLAAAFDWARSSAAGYPHGNHVDALRVVRAYAGPMNASAFQQLVDRITDGFWWSQQEFEHRFLPKWIADAEDAYFAGTGVAGSFYTVLPIETVNSDGDRERIGSKFNSTFNLGTRELAAAMCAEIARAKAAAFIPASTTVSFGPYDGEKWLEVQVHLPESVIDGVPTPWQDATYDDSLFRTIVERVQDIVDQYGKWVSNSMTDYFSQVHTVSVRACVADSPVAAKALARAYAVSEGTRADTDESTPAPTVESGSEQYSLRDVDTIVVGSALVPNPGTEPLPELPTDMELTGLECGISEDATYTQVICEIDGVAVTYTTDATGTVDCDTTDLPTLGYTDAQIKTLNAWGTAQALRADTYLRTVATEAASYAARVVELLLRHGDQPLTEQDVHEHDALAHVTRMCHESGSMEFQPMLAHALMEGQISSSELERVSPFQVEREWKRMIRRLRTLN